MYEETLYNNHGRCWMDSKAWNKVEVIDGSGGYRAIGKAVAVFEILSI